MAYIRRLPSGKWNAVVRHPSGRRMSRTDPLKRAVVAWAQETEAAIRAGTVSADRARRVTVGQWHDRWIRTRNVEPVTVDKERSHLRVHILPRWGTWPLDSIARSDVQAWVTDLTHAGLSGNHIAGIYRTFAKLMGDAVEERLLAASPCRKIEKPRSGKPTPRWFTQAEYDRLQLALDGESAWQAMVGLGCFTGIRPGELGGLDVGVIDFDRQLVRIEQVLTRRHGLRAYPKTDASRRWVPFPEEVGELLWRVVADKSLEEPVFTMVRGARLHYANWSARVWAPALRRAGIGHIRPYVMRHTAASWLVQAGVPFQDIAELLGHGGLDLVTTYAHLAPGAHDRVREVWARARDPQVTHEVRRPASRLGETAGQ